ncbi:hypothetical protein [Kibdelosporangium phytohabitans]|uniref:Uncharacterized protein n=1 Tax=Kibdelosporangium phytohabitans TaxID=860235 RepID=A0A0N7F449_9PSEU|nr:hypothetical protein [Kibdelosporangium phytohabitans]ALG10439.1 hypothetical protein AOZ06_29265 [Kibdelosporangium phytohabitans]MBE1461511.1 hypothetical protein [Kibdelosporangium phytohabitans]
MPLTVQAAAAFVADYRNPYEHDDELITWQRDLLSPFGVPFDETLLAQGPNIGFSELAEQALRAMPAAVGRPDMVIVTYGMPDWYPFKTISAYLDYLLGGGSTNFGVSDQGLRAPFTALRIGEAYARSGRCETLALFVVDQTTFGYEVPLVQDLQDSGVFLLFGPAGSLELSELRSGTDVVELLGDPGDDTLVVAGPWIDADKLDRFTVHQVPAGSYCTSVWLALAEHHQEWADRYQSVVLCDTDPRTGRSEIAVLRPSREANE